MNSVKIFKAITLYKKSEQFTRKSYIYTVKSARFRNYIGIAVNPYFSTDFHTASVGEKCSKTQRFVEN